jgi:DNA-binding XRE family transcriptional regulator
MTSIDDIKRRRPADENAIAEHRARLVQGVRAYRLRELREASQQTQVQMAARLHVSQNRVSALERGDIEHTQIETLRSYAEALGGRLRVEVQIDDETYTVA